MKKTILIAVVLAALAGLFATGAVSAQGPRPPAGPRDGAGPMHDYMLAAFSEVLGLSVDQLESRLAAGETMVQIAISEGIAIDDLPALMQRVRTRAMENAVAAGALTQEQAQWMRQQGARRGGGMMGNGSGFGPCDGTGVPAGSGMRRGGRWVNP